MQIQLINVGRNKVNKIFTVKNEKAMWKELKQHILSPNIELIPMEEENKYMIVAGIYDIGEIIIK